MRTKSYIQLKSNTRHRNRHRAHHHQIQPEIEEAPEAQKEEDQEVFVDFNGAVVQSWASYISFSKDKPPNPQKMPFFVNPYYDELQKRAHYAEQSDELGKVNNEDKFDFWIVLLEGSVYAISSRRALLERVIDQFKITEVEKTWVDITGVNHKGIEAYDEVPKRSCIRIKKKPSNPPGEDFWIICFRDDYLRTNWLMNLQKELNNVLELHEEGKSNEIHVKSPFGLTLDTIDPLEKRPTDDGFWKLMSDWSTCTVACGGGTQTQQRRCVPPLPGHLPCQGEAILVKKCNEDPCPADAIQSGEALYQQAGIRLLNYSKDPQTYERCIILKVDVDTILHQDSGPDVRVPQRIVVNNSTVTVFDEVHYKSIANAFKLKHLEVLDTKNENECLDLLDKTGGSPISVCAPKQYTGDHDRFVKNLRNRLAFMRDSCPDEMPTTGGQPNANNLQFKKQMTQLLDADLKATKKAASSGPKYAQEEAEMQNNVGEEYSRMMADAMKSLQKEMVVQGRLQQEEQQKEVDKTHTMTFQMQQQKQKLNQLEQDERLSEMKASFDQSQIEQKNKLDKIKDQLKEVISTMRSRQNAKVKQLMDVQMLNNRQQRDEMNQLRIKTAFATVQASHIGNKYRCKLGQSDDEIATYCLKAYQDFDDIELCKTKEEFCFQCCNHEFGALKVDERKQCYKDICGEKRVTMWKPMDKA